MAPTREVIDLDLATYAEKDLDLDLKANKALPVWALVALEPLCEGAEAKKAKKPKKEAVN